VRSTGGSGRGARQASPKALAIAGGVIVLVILAVVLSIVLTKNNSSTTGGSCDGTGDGPTICIASGTPKLGSSSSPTALLGAADVATMFKNIPQTGLVLGKADAPATLIEYIDLQCPNCQIFETTELPTLIKDYVRPGKLKIKMQPWSILDRSAAEHDSDRGQKATIAASMQNKAFNFAEVLYDNQGTEATNWMTDATISNIAASVDGLDPYKLATDANGSATRSVITSINNFANAHPNEMTGTPAIYLAKGNGTPKFYVAQVPDLASLENEINKLLK